MRVACTKWILGISACCLFVACSTAGTVRKVAASEERDARIDGPGGDELSVKKVTTVKTIYQFRGALAEKLFNLIQAKATRSIEDGTTNVYLYQFGELGDEGYNLRRGDSSTVDGTAFLKLIPNLPTKTVYRSDRDNTGTKMQYIEDVTCTYWIEQKVLKGCSATRTESSEE
jgi:hypothetical protein